jgi:deoxycytidine triphosphate deaminase
LHNVFQKSKLAHGGGVSTTLDLSALDSASLYQHLEPYEADEVVLGPGEFILGETAEAISIPNHLCGWIEGKSGRARAGLIVHCTALHIAPGWGYTAHRLRGPGVVAPASEETSGATAKPKRITLEMVNLGSVNLLLRPGLGIAQLLLMRLGSPTAVAYSGVHMSRGT